MGVASLSLACIFFSLSGISIVEALPRRVCTLSRRLGCCENHLAKRTLSEAVLTVNQPLFSLDFDGFQK